MSETEPSTSCSIVVPTFNRPAVLARCLAGFAEQDYPRELWEVVVVDDGSDAPLERIVAAAAERIRVRLLRKEHRGPAHARNHGVQHADGELIAFTDDDCTPERGWLRAFAATYVKRPRAMLGGHTWNALPRDPYATASQLLIDYLYSYYNAGTEDARFFTSNNMAVGRASFLELGGFDPLFRYAAGEDRELCARWRHSGLPLVYTAEARVGHAHTMGMRGFLRQHLGYGRGAYYFRIRESQRNREGVRLEPPRFYTNMMRLPFRKLGWFGGVRAAGLLALAQAGNAAGYFLEMYRAGRRGGAPPWEPPVRPDPAGRSPDPVTMRRGPRDDREKHSWRDGVGRQGIPHTVRRELM